VEDLAAAVEQTTSVLTCSNNVIEDLAEQCHDGVEIWSPLGADNAKPVVELLRDVLAERERHQRALIELCQRLDEYVQRDVHHHLEPVESYAELVYRRLFEPPADSGIETA
jgi:hypothetical protein